MLRSLIFRAAMVAALVTVASSCSDRSGFVTNPCGLGNPCQGGGNGGGQTGDVVRIGFGILPATVYAENTFPLGAQPLDVNGVVVPGVTITYTSSDPSIAEVDGSGAVHAKKPGTVTITATGGGKTASVTVTVILWSLLKVDVGGDFTCGVTPANEGYCWGRGQHIGVETDSTCFGTGLLEPCALEPLHVAPTLNFNTVSSGGSHACAITPAKQAYCWGNNDYGQLGNGKSEAGGNPTRVVGGLAFASISSGGAHTCGIIPDGTTYCWGDDKYGELGNYRELPSTTPIPVDGGLKFASVSAGGPPPSVSTGPRPAHTCALTADGTAYCWGANQSGQLGDGTLTESDVPVAVAGGLKFKQISAGGSFTCALPLTGPVHCWGANNFGQLGVGATSAVSTVPVPISGGVILNRVEAGDSTSCGLTSDGVANCWGANFDGQVGDGTVNNVRPAPTPVSGNLTFTSLSTAAHHTCGVAADGTYCWGGDYYGALGDQLQAVIRPLPVHVAAPRQP